jgi:hypothetical protein
MRLREGLLILPYKSFPPLFRKRKINVAHTYRFWNLNRCSRKNHFLSQDAIQFDADLVANSERSLETLVSVGMTLGVSTRNKGLQVPELQKCSLE